ncbi:MAG: adenosylmethionine--8-amino-7-oxononanoate transaminase [Pseudomonadota bacterium]
MLSANELLELDREYIWHPYTSFTNPSAVLPVRSAHGVYLELSDGRKLIDGMSSWWSVLHGYNHPDINKAITDQVSQLAHVMFAGLTHEPAAILAKKLVEITPHGLNKVFFSDSGSVAVEVALKMAIQYWYSQGQAQRTTFLSLRNGYHGDTFGAMSVCDPYSGMHHLFNQSLSRHLFAEAPSCGFNDKWDERGFTNFSTLLQRNRQKVAAVILEPIVQGAGGMRFYSPIYLQRVRKICDDMEVLLIADEIATGFGRTGKLFACDHANISPDIMCIGKALTGGYITLAATLCNDKVSNGICRGGKDIFMHGPTYMANPLACAAANASIDLLLKNDWQKQVNAISAQLTVELEPCRTLKAVADVRVLGAIGVVELKEAADLASLQPQFVEQGIWVRPFGKLVYIMPPFIIAPKDLQKLTSGIFNVLSKL